MRPRRWPARARFKGAALRVNPTRTHKQTPLNGDSESFREPLAPEASDHGGADAADGT